MAIIELCCKWMGAMKIGVLSLMSVLILGVPPFLKCSDQLSVVWTQSTAFPEARAGYAAGAIGGKLIIAGGTYWEGTKGHWTKKIFSPSTHAFDPKTER